MNRSLAFADRGSAFRLQRQSLMNGSFTTALDPDVEDELQRLDDLLGKRVLSPAPAAPSPAPAPRPAAAKKAGAPAAAAPPPKKPARKKGTTAIDQLLALPLKAWISEGKGWPSSSLAEFLSNATDDPALKSVSDYVNDADPDLAEIAYAVQDQLEANRWKLDPNVRAVLEGRTNIRDYLIARAWRAVRIDDPEAMVHYILGNRAGVRSVIDYVAVSAGRAIVAARRLNVTGYTEDGKPFSERIRTAAPSFAKAAFSSAVDGIAKDIMFNSDAAEIIDKAGYGALPPSIRAKLIASIQNSPIEITQTNAKFFLPHFLAQAYDQEPATADEFDEPTGEDRSWRVQFEDTLDLQGDVDRGAVHYAAQLFHGMVLGDELGLFEAVDYLIHSRMVVAGGMDASNASLRNDLKLYALSNKFRDLEAPGQRIEDRTRPSERRMFARAVFDQGEGELMMGMEPNSEFRSLWEVLVLESARYLDRAQESYNPESFVSKQNVMQAVEDLQYNLSTYCVGWPQVIAPVVDAELNFVLRRFLKNPAVAKQVLPNANSWKRVVDKLNAERPKKRPVRGAALLYAKALQGAAIIDAIADYDPASFEDEGNFSAFISLVDGYITTESKLQPRRRPKRVEDDATGDTDEDAPYQAQREPVANDDEDGMSADHDRAEAAGGWDF